MKTIGWIVLGATVLWSVGCGRDETEESVLPRPVVTIRVAEPVGHVDRSFSGATAVVGSVEFGFEVGGRIVEIKAVAGRTYQEGDELARIDTSALQEEVKRVQADATRTSQELGRAQQMFESENASQAELDAAIAAHKSAQAALANAKRNVDHGTLRMPYDGTIGDVLKEAQDVVSIGNPIVIIQGQGPLEMEIGVPTELITQVQPGMKGSARLGSVKDKQFEVTVKVVKPRVSQNTTYPVTLRIKPIEGVNLVEGMDGEVTLSFQNEHGAVITVPVSCVVASPDGSRHVWVVEPDAGGKSASVKKQVVQTGEIRAEGRLEILDGLRPGLLLVSRGASRMKPGLKVSLELQSGE